MWLLAQGITTGMGSPIAGYRRFKNKVVIKKGTCDNEFLDCETRHGYDSIHNLRIYEVTCPL